MGNWQTRSLKTQGPRLTFSPPVSTVRPMSETLGRSVYLTSFDLQRPAFEQGGNGEAVFLSLHISEEFSPAYCAKAEETCRWLSERGYRIIGDVSTKTVDQFRQPDLVRLAEAFGLWALRVDYGFSQEEISALAQRFPIVLNASTTDPDSARRLAQGAVKVMAMHNFYPRPETGLDDSFFRETTQALRAAGLSVLAFIPGDEELRGPLHLGLPTLERHRGVPPSACFADLAVNFGVEKIFAGDPGISSRELRRIRRFCGEGVLEIPARLEGDAAALYGRIFTNRVDSPTGLIRFTESRTYSCFGTAVEPENCAPRRRGSITLDNSRYGRYSGELQMVLRDLPADERVNVVGHVEEAYLLLADCIQRGRRFVLTPN